MQALRCPICKKPVNPPHGTPLPGDVFPFCSDRCKLIDLGRWLDGKYQIDADTDDFAGRDDAADPADREET